MAMDFKKTFGYNRAKAREGMWVNLNDEGTTSIKVAKLGTVEYMNSLNKYSRKYQAMSRINRLSSEQIIDMSANTLADCILLDWKGVEEDGQPIPYSRENAYRLLKEYEDFRTIVEAHANDPDLFQDNIMDVETDSKNSLTTSNGT